MSHACDLLQWMVGLQQLRRSIGAITVEGRGSWYVLPKPRMKVAEGKQST